MMNINSEIDQNYRSRFGPQNGIENENSEFKVQKEDFPALGVNSLGI